LDEVMDTSSNAEATEPRQSQPTADSVAVAQSTIAVHRGRWTNLPADLADLVAPPVTVSAVPFERPIGSWRRGQLARSRGNMPVGKHQRAAR
jgi:hypothetical protein